MLPDAIVSPARRARARARRDRIPAFSITIVYISAVNLSWSIRRRLPRVGRVDIVPQRRLLDPAQKVHPHPRHAPALHVVPVVHGDGEARLPDVVPPARGQVERLARADGDVQRVRGGGQRAGSERVCEGGPADEGRRGG